jgi:hypothetical protein
MKTREGASLISEEVPIKYVPCTMYRYTRTNERWMDVGAFVIFVQRVILGWCMFQSSKWNRVGRRQKKRTPIYLDLFFTPIAKF